MSPTLSIKEASKIKLILRNVLGEWIIVVIKLKALIADKFIDLVPISSTKNSTINPGWQFLFIIRWKHCSFQQIFKPLFNKLQNFFWAIKLLVWNCSWCEEHRYSKGCISNSDCNKVLQAILWYMVGKMDINFTGRHSLLKKTEHFAWAPSQRQHCDLAMVISFVPFLIPPPVDYCRNQYRSRW